MDREGSLDPRERQTLGALRYAVNDEAASYLAIMRLFTTGMSRFPLRPVRGRGGGAARGAGARPRPDTVDARLSYLVEHGNLARSPRETEARSVREYLSNRARYQLTQRGELVQRHVEELLGHTDTAREVSSEMLPGILAGLVELSRSVRAGLAEADPREVAVRIGTLFAQFELLVSSTRHFYTYLSQVLVRYDLDRDEFQMFKTALLDYLQRFVDEIARHMPQLAEVLRTLAPDVPALCARANVGQRLLGVDGEPRPSRAGAGPGRLGRAARLVRRGAGARTPTPTTSGGWRPTRCGRCWSTCVGSPRVPTASRAGTPTCSRWPGGSTKRTTNGARPVGFGVRPVLVPAPRLRRRRRRRPGAADRVLVAGARRRGAGGLRSRASGRSVAGRAREDYAAAKPARLAERDASSGAVGPRCGRWPAGGAARQPSAQRRRAAALLDLYARRCRGRRPLTEDTAASVDTPVDDERLRLTIRGRPGDPCGSAPPGRLTLTGIALHIALEPGHAGSEGDDWRAEA